MKSLLVFALIGFVLSQANNSSCDDRDILLPSQAGEYKHCSSLDNGASINPDQGTGDVRIEGFESLMGRISYYGKPISTLTSLWCDAKSIGSLAISNAAELENITFPNLISIDSISITNADNLKRFHAPRLRTISHWLSLTNVPQLSEFNTSSVPRKDYSTNKVALNIGYYPDEDAGTGGFADRHDLTGTVVLSNVSQAAVDSLIGNPAVALPTVEFGNSPMVHHVNYSAHQAVSLTIKGTGETKLTLNGYRLDADSIKSVYISGVKEIGTDRIADRFEWRLLVKETHIVDNPNMKEAVIAFDARNVLTIANNPLLETIRMPPSHIGPYENFTIFNNTKLRMPATFITKASEDDTYRESDKTLAKFNWGGFGSNELHLDGHFDLDFFLLDNEHANSLKDKIGGDIVINSTAPDFDCAKLSTFSRRSYRNETGKTFTCNGETSVRVESLGSRLLSSECCFVLALAVGIWSIL